jgi:hypothetical protein
VKALVRVVEMKRIKRDRMRRLIEGDALNRLAERS